MVKGIEIAAAASVIVLLAGCSTLTPLPPPLSDADVQEIRDAQNADWWLSMFPGEQVPEIAPVAEVAQLDLSDALARCILAAELPGVVPDDAERGYRLTPGVDAAELNRTYYRCVVQYPTEVGDPASSGYFSREQQEWLYDFFSARLVPCLRLAGYTVGEPPPRDEFVDSVYGGWSPYFAMSPNPSSAAEWQRVDAQCPPPPVGSFYRVGE